MIHLTDFRWTLLGNQAGDGEGAAGGIGFKQGFWAAGMRVAGCSAKR